MNADAAQHQLSHRQMLIAFSGLLLGMLLGALDQTVVATALPTIVRELGGLDQLSWVVTAYLRASIASIPLWGMAAIGLVLVVFLEERPLQQQPADSGRTHQNGD
jgi:MFS family permease